MTPWNVMGTPMGLRAVSDTIHNIDLVAGAGQTIPVPVGASFVFMGADVPGVFILPTANPTPALPVVPVANVANVGMIIDPSGPLMCNGAVNIQLVCATEAHVSLEFFAFAGLASGVVVTA